MTKMLSVIHGGTTVAYINKQDRLADNYNRLMPWQLLHVNGKVDRSNHQQGAKDAAKHYWPGCSFATPGMLKPKGRRA